MESFDFLKDVINAGIEARCERNQSRLYHAVVVESECDEKIVTQLCDYLKENEYEVKLIKIAKNLRKLEISWRNK